MMAVQSEATAARSEASRAEPSPYLFTVEEYYRMGEAGIFGPEARVELIEGVIIRMNPIGDPHAGTVNRLTRQLVRAVGDAGVVTVQNPIRLDGHSDPQPDFAVVRPRADFYATSPPTPPDILLLVEVADSSLRYDTRTKGPLYARFGIPELWIVDLGRGVVVAYTDPTEDGYLGRAEYRRGQSLRPVSFPDLTIAVIDVLG